MENQTLLTARPDANVHAARLDVAYDDADTPMQRRAMLGVEFGL